MALPWCCFTPHYLVSNCSRIHLYNLHILYYHEPELHRIPLIESWKRNRLGSRPPRRRRGGTPLTFILGLWPPPSKHLRDIIFGRKPRAFSLASAHWKPLILRARAQGARLHHQGELRITRSGHYTVFDDNERKTMKKFSTTLMLILNLDIRTRHD